MSEILELQNVAIWTRALDLEEDDEILDFFREFRDLEIPDIFDNTIRNIREEDIDGSALIFSDSLPMNPGETLIKQGSVNLILFSVDDGAVRVACDIDAEHLKVVNDVFNKVLEYTGIHVSDLDIEHIIEDDFHNLNFSITGPERIEFQGVRFVDDEFNYIVQSTDAPEMTSDWPEVIGNEEISTDEKLNITSTNASHIDHFDVEEPGDFIPRKIEKVESTLHELAQ